MSFIDKKAISFHLRQQIAEFGEVERVKVPKRDALAVSRLARQNRTRFALHPAEFRFERFAQEPRRLRVERGVLNPSIANRELLEFLQSVAESSSSQESHTF